MSDHSLSRSEFFNEPHVLLWTDSIGYIVRKDTSKNARGVEDRQAVIRQGLAHAVCHNKRRSVKERQVQACDVTATL
jgi:hypothetical protein